MNAQHEDTPPPGISRREWRRQQQASPDSPSLNAADAPAAAPASAPPVAAATILTVCTGNICRSPMAEVLLRAQLEPLGVRVHSAGTHALVDHEMTPQARDLAVGHGANESHAGGHRARYLVEPLVRETDLVLTMAREHRSHTVQLLPSALKRTFTVREFARLASGMTDAEARRAADAAGDSPSDRLQALARAVGDRRGMLAPGPAEDDDVIDPYRRSQTTYELSASQLVQAVEEVVRVVRAALS